MSIKVRCPNADCGKVAVVKDEFAGKRARCTGCGTIVTVPGGAPAQRPAARATAGAHAGGTARAQVQASPPRRPAPQPASEEEVAYAAAEPQGEPGGAAGGGAVLVYIGVGLLGLLAVSVFLPWLSIFGIGISGMNLMGGLLVLVFAGGAAAAVTTLFLLKKGVPLVLLAGGAAGTFGLLTVLGVLLKGAPGLGLWIGLAGAAGATGIFLVCSLKNPCHFPFNKEGASPFLRNFGALLGAQGIALLLGLLMMFIGTGVSMGGMGGDFPGGGFPGRGGKMRIDIKMPDMKMPADFKMPDMKF